ncbi:MAG TPA: adenylate/guanylate cyclase domain-containing protein [Candidatus Limnocylindria bacterium]|nr:adenylate/guanylate cyclase domain-containing protein [Candidatus Limnocylindria bacterium]
MTATTLGRARERVLAIGRREGDPRELRLRKEALVLTAVTISGLATIWTLTYLVLGRPLAALAPLAFQVVSVVSLVHFYRTGDFNVLRLAQIVAILVLPFALQWSLGGFDNSSAVMVWAFAAPLGALVFYGPSRAIIFFLAYIGLAVFSGIIDPLLPAVQPMPPVLRLAFFVLNIGGVSIVTYAVLQYFVHALVAEQERSDRLLRNVLPEAIAERLKSGEQLIANDHPQVTVLFADVVNFTPLARREEASSVIAILDELFSRFDALAEKHGLEKIKTMGDAYMAVAGAPEPRPDHAPAAARMALDMLDELQGYCAATGREMQLRVGVHSGHAVAGVIGKRKFAYDLWGDAVNLASRMESQGLPGRIHVSEAVARQLGDGFRLKERGTVEIKGLGAMRTYFVERG